MTSEEEWAWAIGLFEGEGSIVLRKTSHGPWFARELRVSMCDLDVLERFQSVVGTGNIYLTERPEPQHRDVHTWVCSRWPETERILTRMLPFLGERRAAKAREMLANPAQPLGGGHWKTHCKRGHLLDAENAPFKNGKRQCRQCVRVYEERRKQRRRREKEKAK